MPSLFSAVELADGDADLAGYRLHRVELFNWGTFDKRVWTFELNGTNALLTGDIGSGKSTIVDAITTLLLPAHKISYNKAAGAETRERSLRSYVLGFYKSERSEATGSSRPLGLRSSSSYSVILGVFGNRALESLTTLAQVFWTRDGDQGQPSRFYVIADGAATIGTDFAGFGSDVADLRKQLRRAGARLYDHFPEYGRDYRRRLGIESDQAMDLFHQTVSMKSVGDLNEFVRGHMLEPFDAAGWIDRLVDHFDDLTNAHEAVLRARAQLADLTPLLTDCDAYDAMGEEILSLADQRAALRFYCAQGRSELLAAQVASLKATLAEREREVTRTRSELRRLRERGGQLQIERAGHGGNRIAEIERLIADDTKSRDARQRRFHRFNELLTEAGLPRIDAAEQFAARRLAVAAESRRVDEARADLQNRLTEAGVQASALDTEATGLNEELRSLRSRRSSIPKWSLDLRAWLCRELCLPEAELPFAGELIAVRGEDAAWEGVAERVLHSFALSLLVPNAHYAAVSDWINDHHLGARVIYYRVPAALGTFDDGAAGVIDRQLFAKLEIKETPFSAWLERELRRRAGYDCVDTMEEFRRAARAVTRSGQIKGSGGRHEKDDRTRIDDRSSYVLGWSNEQKISVLVDHARHLQGRQNDIAAERQRLEGFLARTNRRAATLAKLGEFDDFSELDWQALVNRIADLAAEKRQLEESSGELHRLTQELEAVSAKINAAEGCLEGLNSTIGGATRDLESADEALAETRRILDEPECDAARGFFAPLAELLADARPSTPAAYDRFESDAGEALTARREARGKSQASLGNRIVSLMVKFREKHPLVTTDLDNSLVSAGEYRGLRDRLVEDDLPRFEAEFKEYLNTNTIRDIAGFHSQLQRQAELIKERIETINRSLIGIDYNPGRYIRLEGKRTPNVEVRDFIADLRACTDDSLLGDGSEQYSEQKFLQVKRLIERFKGRDGQTEIDKAWARRVTDVRNWFVFSASERWREDDSEYENYADSGGKSGGQKEKLAYTILAASLAYQFKLDVGAARSKTFRFVVIDEAFGRGSDESTRFALALFRQLGLQLLIVTPLQKIHVIEPFVSAVGFVDNPGGNYSRLQGLTIEEYRELQATHQRSPRLAADLLGA